MQIGREVTRHQRPAIGITVVDTPRIHGRTATEKFSASLLSPALGQHELLPSSEHGKPEDLLEIRQRHGRSHRPPGCAQLDRKEVAISLPLCLFSRHIVAGTGLISREREMCLR
jgi:hypothetical protein